MIKKTIAYILKFVNAVPKPDQLNPDPYDYKYEEGSRDVADNVKLALDDLPDLFSIYELNPYGGKGSDLWEEIAVTRDPETCKQLAEALFKDHNGMIDLRYEYKDNKAYALKMVGDQVRSYIVVTGGK